MVKRRPNATRAKNEDTGTTHIGKLWQKGSHKRLKFEPKTRQTKMVNGKRANKKGGGIVQWVGFSI